MQTQGVDGAKLVHSAFLPEAVPCIAEVSAPLAADCHLLYSNVMYLQWTLEV